MTSHHIHVHLLIVYIAGYLFLSCSLRNLRNLLVVMNQSADGSMLHTVYAQSRVIGHTVTGGVGLGSGLQGRTLY